MLKLPNRFMAARAISKQGHLCLPLSPNSIATIIVITMVTDLLLLFRSRLISQRRLIKSFHINFSRPWSRRNLAQSTSMTINKKHPTFILKTRGFRLQLEESLTGSCGNPSKITGNMKFTKSHHKMTFRKCREPNGLAGNMC